MSMLAASTLGDSFTGDYERIRDVEWADTTLDGGWLVLVCDWGTVHCVPVLDDVLHTVVEGDDCVCLPEVTAVGDGFVILHSSLDGREIHEDSNVRPA
jgi:hypothetical protein